MKPDVSVIIPVYNGEHNIKTSLNSLLEQSYSNFEAIIIDDGSHDNTSEVISELVGDDKRFKYIYQENSGVSKARNKGIVNAKGKYICFLDSDDRYIETFIEKMFAQIEAEDADVCYCGHNYVTPTESKELKMKFKKGDILTDYIDGSVHIHTTAWMIKRALLEQYDIAFQEGVSWGEDIEFFSEVLSVTDKVTFVKEYLTDYNFGFDSNQLSSFSMDKIKHDHDSIKRIQKNKRINKNSKINSLLIDHRLPAPMVYRLVEAFNQDIEDKVIIEYYDKYSSSLEGFTWVNGLRSVKLNIYKVKLKYKIKKLKEKM